MLRRALPRLGMAVARPLSSALRASYPTFGQPPLFSARRPTIACREPEVPAYSPVAPFVFEIRCASDAIRLLARAAWLGAVFLPPLLLLLPGLLLPSRFRRLLEEEMLRAFERGGACLIKLGQWASTRPDILPVSLCNTLSSLHDSAPAHHLRHSERAIEAAFGAPVGSIFARLSPTPVGSGCIAQVHEGETRDGLRVAIKARCTHYAKPCSFLLLLPT